MTASNSASPNTNLKPVTFNENAGQSPSVGGVPVKDLVEHYGTPLYVMDEATLRASAQSYRKTLDTVYPAASLPLYACKANMNMGLIKLMEQEGMGLDVVSGGEIYTAVQAGFPMERVLFNGNNKTAEEIQMALIHGVGHISADNFHDLSLIHQIGTALNKKS